MAETPYELLNASGDVSQWVRKACDKAGIRPVIGYTCILAHEGEKVEVKIYCQSQCGLRNLLRIQKVAWWMLWTQPFCIPNCSAGGEGNVLVFGKLSPFWMEKNLHAVKALRETFDNVFYQVDLSEFKAEQLDAEVLKATTHFFHTFNDEKNDSFLVEPILIADCNYPDKDDARTKIVLNKIAMGAAYAQSDDQYFKDIDEHYAAVRLLFDGERWNTDVLFERMCRHAVEIAEGTEKIRRLGVKIKHLEAAARHEVEVAGPIDAVIRNTVVIRDTVLILRQRIEMITPHIQLTGIIEDNRLRGEIRVPVTLLQAVWVEYKGWWFWRRVKAVHQTISSDNPYAEIRYSEYIRILK